MKYITKRNLLNALGLGVLTLFFLKMYDIQTVNELIAKVQYYLENWKDIPVIELVGIAITYLTFITNDDIKSKVFNNLLDSNKLEVE